MPQANWMLLEWELEQLARKYGWVMDTNYEGDKVAVTTQTKAKVILNLTQLAHDLIDRGVTVHKHAVRTQT